MFILAFFTIYLIIYLYLPKNNSKKFNDYDYKTLFFVVDKCKINKKKYPSQFTERQL